MDIDQVLRIANSALFARCGRRLSEVEAAILLGSLRRHTYEKIASDSGYAESYLKYDVGPKLWKYLGQALGEPVSKTNFQASLEAWWQKSLIAATQTQEMEVGEAHRQPLTPPSESQIENPKSKIPQTDWGEGVDISKFYGRSPELTTLTQWIVGDRCHVIALLGMGGIGKTALSVKLTHQILMASSIQGRNEFDFTIWRSLRNASPLETLLADLMPFLSNQQDTQPTLDRLMYHLRSSRCLVILDNLETILQGGERAGQFLSGYENYGELLRLVSESNHQSCLLLTSREKPAEVAAFEGVDLKVRSLSLSGSEQAARSILQAKGLAGSEAQKILLCDRYGNSPLALKIVATSIQDLFDGNIAEFLQEDTFIFNGIRRLLDRQFDRLSQLERSIMYWLAINREWTSVAELHEDIIPQTSRANILESLEGLVWRSLIEKQAGKYTQQPMVMEYITEQFIEQIIAELTTAKLDLFDRYALMKTTLKEYVRESQVRLILGAIAELLTKTLRETMPLEQYLQALVETLRSLQFAESYGGGNLINLCIQQQLNLTGFDFSGLTIRHAYLQEINLHQVNLAKTNFTKSTFAQTFGGVLSTAFSPDGFLLATGDTGGRVCLWNVEDGQLLSLFKSHTSWVTTIELSAKPVINQDRAEFAYNRKYTAISGSHDRSCSGMSAQGNASTFYKGIPIQLNRQH